MANRGIDPLSLIFFSVLDVEDRSLYSFWVVSGWSTWSVPAGYALLGERLLLRPSLE